MKFTLTDYQHDVTSSVVQRLNSAVAMFDNDGAKTAVGLTAPTGSGKTVIATAVLEKLMFGGGIQSPNKNLTVLWLTDDPSLNEQSKDKILKASSVIQPSQIEMIDSTYDRETFEAGKIHFVNIGRLTSGATSHVVTGDNRRWSLWETIGNTVSRRNRDFLFIVDEAHRGSSVKAGDKKTIMRTVLDGGPVTVTDASGTARTIINQPVAVMLGISATPKKFEAAMQDGTSDRMLMKVSADVNKVRESGMIKDLIQVNHPTDSQPTDDTLVRAAVRDLVAYDRLWAREAAVSGVHSVKPLLVIQVPDKISPAAVGTLVASLTDEWKELGHQPGQPTPIVHSFGEKAAIDLPGGRVIPHMAPELIEENHHVRVVIFKAALTTGWDCPRAEVMVSLRAAREHTAIAQLIGRMVRTPVAGRIEEPGLEELNSVSLYLPHYSKDEVAQVVASFVGDADVEVPVAINPVVFERNPDVPEELWGLELPKELKPKRAFASETARLAALGSRLDNLGIRNPFNPESTLTDEVIARVAAVLIAEYERLQPAIDTAAESLMEVTYDKVGYDQYTGTESATTALKVRTSAANIRELKDKAVKRMPDASGAWLYNALFERFGDNDEAVTRLSAMAAHEEVDQALEASSTALIDSWRQTFNPEVSRLGTDARTELDTLWHPHGEPLPGVFKLPESVKAKTQKVVAGEKGKVTVDDIETFTGHVFADKAGHFPMVATGWEKEVLESELSRDTLKGWYRNPASASQGLSVSYMEGGVDKSLFPDFLFFHEVDGTTAVDLVDPHNHSLADTPGKWSALARFARENPGVFRRVTAVIRNKNSVLKGLELAGRATTVVEERLAAASGGEDIAAIFEEFGGNY